MSQHPAVQNPAHPRKSPTNLARSPLLVGPRRKKSDRGQRSAFPSDTSRFAPLILAHRDSALPWLVNDRSSLRLRRIWCVPTRWSATRLSAPVLPASRVPPHLPKCTKLELGRGAHLGTPSSTNHTDTASQPIG